MKKLFAAAAVLAMLAIPAVAQDKKPEAAKPAAAACCSPECKVEKGKCATHEAKKCAKDCAKACCKPAEAKKS